MTEPVWNATDLQAADRVEFHLLVVALPGHTVRHLRDHHGIQPTDDKRENARLHLEAHGVPADARPVGILRLFKPYKPRARSAAPRHDTL